MAQKYSKAYNKEVQRIVNNYNAKIKRLKASNKRGIEIPEQVTTRSLKATTKNKRELRLKLNELKRFSKRGAEVTRTTRAGVTISKFRQQNIRLTVNRAKRQLKKEVEFYEQTTPTVFGVRQAVSLAQTGTGAYNRAIAELNRLSKNINTLKENEIKTLLARAKNVISDFSKETKEENIDRWLDIIDKLTYYYPEIENDKNKIYDKLKKLSPEQFTKLYRTEKSISSIIERYFQLVGAGVDPQLIHDDIVMTYRELAKNIDVIIKDYE